MMLAADFLNKLVAAIPLLEILAKMTTSNVDNWILDLAKRIRDDEEAMEQLAIWLAWVPFLKSAVDSKGNPEPPIPASLKKLEVSLIGLRGALHRG